MALSCNYYNYCGELIETEFFMKILKLLGPLIPQLISEISNPK
ncbi:8173_t:CDS:2, partial [Gigaspora margarita]